jgi:hypothetical protein
MCFLEIITKTAINRGVHEKKGKKKKNICENQERGKISTDKI